MAKKKKKKATQQSIEEFRKKFELLDNRRKKNTARAIQRRRRDVWEMMCQEIPQTEMADLLNVARSTVALDVKYLKERASDRVRRMKESPACVNLELGNTVQKLDSLTAAAFMEYSMAKSGCLIGETKIWTNRGMVQIQDVKAGDLVMVHDEGCAVTAPVVELIPKGKKPVYRLRTRHREIVATGNHPFLCDARGGPKWVALEQLTPSDRSANSRVVGDKVFIATDPALVTSPLILGELRRPFYTEPVISIDPHGEADVYDIEVDHKGHNFVANGIVVHNSEKAKFLDIATKTLSTKTRILQETGFLPKAGIEIRARVDKQPTFADRFGEDSPLTALDNPNSRHRLLGLAQKIIGLAQDTDDDVIDVTAASTSAAIPKAIESKD